MSKKLTTTAKTTTVAGGGGILTTWAAMLASQKWGIPIEVTATVAGVIAAFIGRWAGRLTP